MAVEMMDAWTISSFRIAHELEACDWNLFPNALD
jgi:hypothetical protein